MNTVENCIMSSSCVNDKSLIGQTFGLKHFVSLAETSTGEQLVDVIKQVLESPSIYVFGELLDVHNIKALTGTQHEQYLRLLNIFAYGTYSDYLKEKKENFDFVPELTNKMLTKLRHLSIVSLARCRRHIPYQVLLQELDLENIRDLEDLIIDVIYANVIKGTMDQENSRLEIDVTIGRDVRPEDFQTITNVLNEWCRNCDNILANIEHQISAANQYKEESINVKQTLEAKIASIKKNIKIVENDDAIITDANNVYVRDSAEKSKRIPPKSLKIGYKSGGTKAWRKDN